MKRTILVVWAALMVVPQMIVAQSNSVITLDMKNGTVDDLIVDLLLDQKQYHNKTIEIQNLFFHQFCADSHGVNPTKNEDAWFDDTGTFGVYDGEYSISVHYDHKFWFYFHPADRDGLRFMLSLNGKYIPMVKCVIKGVYFVNNFARSMTGNIFLVTSLEVDGRTYTGTIPASIDGIRINSR
jgi:hypothetical protein